MTPYRLSGKNGKNDAADAQAIREAVSRPNMRFIPVKTTNQQSQLLVHRARQGFIAQRTATLKRLRGLLSEFSVPLPLEAAVVHLEVMQYLENLPVWANTVVGDLLSEVSRADERVAQYDQYIASFYQASIAGRCIPVDSEVHWKASAARFLLQIEDAHGGNVCQHQVTINR